VAEESKHKTPTELGEAVGRKIEELFGDFLGESSIAEPSQAIETPARSSTRDRAPLKEPSVFTGMPAKGPQESVSAIIAGPTRTVLKSSQNMNTPTGASAPGYPQGGKVSFDKIIERIEALTLNVEWEVSPEASAELVERLRALSAYFPGDERARTILAMNNRVLRRFSGSDVTPHPLMVKLLEDSMAVLKSMRLSPEKNSQAEAAIPVLNDIYKKIMSAPMPQAPVDGGALGGEEKASAVESESILNRVSVTIQTLEEVIRRLSRIGGALTQGATISGPETARRLGTLEHLVSQQVGQLSLLHRELAQGGPAYAPPGKPTQSLGSAGHPDGLLTVLWVGAPLAISSSIVAALYPITRTQAEQFKDKQSITLGSRVLLRLPIRKPPENKDQAPMIPGWLVHLNWRQKDYFLLVDRSLGFRRAPAGTDLSAQTKIKFGPVSYSILSESTLR
jgi:hypothetical protein